MCVCVCVCVCERELVCLYFLWNKTEILSEFRHILSLSRDEFLWDFYVVFYINIVFFRFSFSSLNNDDLIVVATET